MGERKKKEEREKKEERRKRRKRDKEQLIHLILQQLELKSHFFLILGLCPPTKKKIKKRKRREREREKERIRENKKKRIRENKKHFTISVFQKRKGRKKEPYLNREEKGVQIVHFLLFVHSPVMRLLKKKEKRERKKEKKRKEKNEIKKKRKEKKEKWKKKGKKKWKKKENQIRSQLSILNIFNITFIHLQWDIKKK